MSAIALVAAVLAGAALMPAQASAHFREEPSQMPLHARDVVGPEWTPFIFYRPPECVPGSFNLVQFFDVPRAFGCGPMTVHSVAFWANGPGIDPAPLRSHSRGLGAVPIWFIRSGDFHRSTADGVLTMAELRALSPLTGTAHWFKEELHPPETARVGLLNLRARGRLDDGRSFRLRILRNWASDRRVVRLRLGR